MLAVSAFNLGQYSSILEAAKAYDVSKSTPSLIGSREDLLGEIIHQPTRGLPRLKKRCLLGIY
ncbi:MAG: hypothetical protein FE78DRAFT_358518 [Acidomyces sp. 'richmondensis']|nr:MAG: hypothetical protein FE78DRAFT_358518 [Acidomyces sp. 'richmondensis']